ncbi:DNA-directed RNA polymerase subunit RPC12/RpoP [Pseudomonas sp. HLS-6 TE3448]
MVLIKGITMKCLICSADAREVDSEMDGIELVCPECGHFGVSSLIMKQRAMRAFDVERTQTFLHCEREINPDRLPIINSETVIWA